MEFGGPTAECAERSALDAVLDEAQQVLSKMIDILEAGGLDQLDAAQKVAFWQRFETFPNQLPLVDHSLIADAEASDLLGSYCFSTMARFLVRVLQLSHGEAALRVRAAATLGPRSTMLGESPAWFGP